LKLRGRRPWSCWHPHRGGGSGISDARPVSGLHARELSVEIGVSRWQCGRSGRGLVLSECVRRGKVERLRCCCRRLLLLLLLLLLLRLLLLHGVGHDWAGVGQATARHGRQCRVCCRAGASEALATVVKRVEAVGGPRAAGVCGGCGSAAGKCRGSCGGRGCCELIVGIVVARRRLKEIMIL
jgi:hypothetical protein